MVFELIMELAQPKCLFEIKHKYEMFVWKAGLSENIWSVYFPARQLRWNGCISRQVHTPHEERKARLRGRARNVEVPAARGFPVPPVHTGLNPANHLFLTDWHLQYEATLATWDTNTVCVNKKIVVRKKHCISFNSSHISCAFSFLQIGASDFCAYLAKNLA